MTNSDRFEIKIKLKLIEVWLSQETFRKSIKLLSQNGMIREAQGEEIETFGLMLLDKDISDDGEVFRVMKNGVETFVTSYKTRKH